MRVVSRHQTALDRLTTEAINILELSRGPPDQDLNSRSEWGQAHIPKLGVTMPGNKRPATSDTDSLGSDSNPHLSYYMLMADRKVKSGKNKIPWNEEPPDE